MNSKEEKWEILNEYPNYMISTFGRIKNIKTQRILKPYVNKKKYVFSLLMKNKKKYNLQVHRLVAKTFIPNPLNKPCVNHIDYNPSNNKVENLEWVTHSENCKHSSKNISNSHKGKTHSKTHNLNVRKAMLNLKDKEHYIYKNRNHFMFRFKINGIDFNKTFKTQEEAIKYKDDFFKENEEYAIK